MKTYITDHSKTVNGHRYSAYRLDMNDMARRRAQKPWIVYRVLGVFLVIGMVAAAFVTSPWMGVPMVLVMLAGAFRK